MPIGIILGWMLVTASAYADWKQVPNALKVSRLPEGAQAKFLSKLHFPPGERETKTKHIIFKKKRRRQRSLRADSGYDEYKGTIVRWLDCHWRASQASDKGLSLREDSEAVIEVNGSFELNGHSEVKLGIRVLDRPLALEANCKVMENRISQVRSSYWVKSTNGGGFGTPVRTESRFHQADDSDWRHLDDSTFPSTALVGDFAGLLEIKGDVPHHAVDEVEQ